MVVKNMTQFASLIAFRFSAQLNSFLSLFNHGRESRLFTIVSASRELTRIWMFYRSSISNVFKSLLKLPLGYSWPYIRLSQQVCKGLKLAIKLALDSD